MSQMDLDSNTFDTFDDTLQKVRQLLKSAEKILNDAKQELSETEKKIISVESQFNRVKCNVEPLMHDLAEQKSQVQTECINLMTDAYEVTLQAHENLCLEDLMRGDTKTVDQYEQRRRKIIAKINSLQQDYGKLQFRFPTGTAKIQRVKSACLSQRRSFILSYHSALLTKNSSLVSLASAFQHKPT